MGVATLYRKYRPQLFADLVGQDHIRATLQAALAQDRVAHAYLFAGPRGTGKTTVARLLAKAINCLKRAPINGEQITGRQSNDLAVEPCNECQMCLETTNGRSLDVIEIDAASNRGIDEMRELREKIKFAPTQARKKVFIIDEVHMLTKEAFNALLKTLEEPPAHAVFVLATTEIHKVPVTISSRCQTFTFKKANLDDLKNRLAAVAAAEQIPADAAAIEFLARLAGGSYRDALSLLDQVSSFYGETLTLEAVQTLLGLAGEDRLLGLLEAISSGDATAALAKLQLLEAEGIDPEQFAAQLVEAGRTLLHIRLQAPVVSANVTAEQRQRWDAQADLWSDSQLIEFIRELVGARQLMKQAAMPLLPLEVAVIKTAQIFRPDAPVPAKPARPPAAGQPTRSRPDQAEVVDEAGETSSETPVVEQVPTDKPLSVAPITDSTQAWRSLLERLRAEHMSIHALLQQAEFGGIENNRMIVRVPFQFAADRLTDTKHRKVIEQAIEEVIGAPLAIECVVHSLHHAQVGDIPEKVALDQEVVDAALEMFGTNDSQLVEG